MTRKSLLIVILFVALMLTPQKAFAVCTPPSDYTSCSVAQFGPKIAGNTNPKNYQQIRDAYNKSQGYSNKIIPVTVIYTTADLANLTFINSNLQAMKDNGLLPIIRISSPVIGSSGNWDRINPNSAKTGAQNLNSALGSFNFGDSVRVYFGNEPNLPTEWGGEPNAQEFANAFAAFIQGAGANRNFKLYLPPMALESGSEDQFAKSLLSDPRIKGNLDGIAVTVYGPTSDKVKALMDRQKSFLSGLDPNLKDFFVSEVGPLINGKLLTSTSDIKRFEDFLSQNVYKKLDLFLKPGEYMTTSFFADLNGDGNIDTTLLVIIDADGNVKVIPLEDYSGSIIAYPLVRTVDGSNDVAIAYSDPVTLVQRGEINSKNPSATYTRGGLFEQFQDNTIPFVKKTLDYLAGPFVSDFKDPEAMRDLVNNPKPENAGVFAKITPLNIQNQLRTAFRENCVNKIFTKKECSIKDPDTGSPVEIVTINPPPTLDISPDYVSWLKNKQNADRWYSIPFFSNPDTIVKKSVTMNACPPGVHTDPLTNNETTVESRIPYVSALKDVSGEMYKLFKPYQAPKVTQKTSTPNKALERSKTAPIANKEPNITLVSQAHAQNNPPPDDNFNPFSAGFSSEITPLGGSKYQVCWAFHPSVSDSNYNFCDWGYQINVAVKGQLQASFQEPILGGGTHCFQNTPTITCTMGSAQPLTVTANKKEDVQVSFIITNGACTGDKCKTIDFRGRIGNSTGPGGPTCSTPSALGGKDPGTDQDPVSMEGHNLLREPHQDLNCPSYIIDPGTNSEVCSDRNIPTDYTIKDPVWAEIKYPFIGTIHKYLASPEGVFNILKPSSLEREKWYEPAASKISYCLTDHPATTMIKGGTLQPYNNKGFDSPPARCDDGTATKTLGAYPPLLGGMDNARQFIFDIFKTGSSGSPSPSYATEDFKAGPSRMQTAIQAVQSTFKKSTATHVYKGDSIGLMGNTGLSEGAHLHFAVYNYKLGDPFVVNDHLLNPCDGFLTCNVQNNTITSGKYDLPIASPTVTQWFGQTPDSQRLYNGEIHRGIDLVNISNPAIKAAAEGDAFFIHGGQELGNGVVIYHPDGTMSLYWHMQ